MTARIARTVTRPVVPRHPSPVTPRRPTTPTRPVTPLHPDVVTGPVHTTVTTPTTTTSTTTTRAASTKTVDGLIDGAKDRLYLHVNHLDADLESHLLKAQLRGVAVHVVVTPGARMDQFEVQRVLALTDSGVDLKVKTSSSLPVRGGVADTVSFVGKPLDPVTTEKPPDLNKDPTRVKNDVAAFDAELKTRVVLSGRGLLAPNKVQLHTMPEEGAGPVVSVINAAKKSVDLEVYQLADRDVVDALKAAAHRGVAVRVMVEPKSLEPSNYASLSKELKAAGVNIQPTPPAFDTHGNVDHAKFMVVDAQELVFGTGNLVRVGLGGNEQAEANNRDFWVEDTQPDSLKEAAHLFDADWNRQPTNAADFNHLVVTPDNAKQDIFSVMDGARTRLLVYNQSLSDKPTIDKLLAAKARGVHVEVLLGAFQNAPNTPPANAVAVATLKAAGIDVKYLTNSYLHAKTVVADDTAFVGSQNFTGGGLVRNREVGAIFNDADLVHQLAGTFDKDWANPGPQPH